ncbi:hypothetical protein [Arthrobacter sp. E3]|uniref:8-oxoguanine DNA glycosylase OGG fold protein n=1 Tax=Arthrobacter sp. E3 TaxID=517402 RepID=UPI001A948950|nr:hypothetical protein [Arthrobacter sp. E3]
MHTISGGVGAPEPAHIPSPTTDSLSIPKIPDALMTALAGDYRSQHSFPWSRKPWMEKMHDLPEVLSLLVTMPDRIDRHHVAQTVSTELAADRVMSGFIAAMVWGWGDAGGRGAVRTRWVLTGVNGRGEVVSALPVDPTVNGRLLQGAEAVREHGPVEGFRTMNNEARIKHLGPSYFTKWLYFTSADAGVESRKTAPILDDRIIEWLAQNAGVQLDIGSTSAYTDYLRLLSAWGAEFGRTPVQVETEVFRLATGRG